MERVNYLPEAVNDLHGIWRYVYDKSGSVVSAVRLIETIDETAAVSHHGTPLDSDVHRRVHERAAKITEINRALCEFPSIGGS